MGWTSELAGRRPPEVTAELLTDRFESEDVAAMVEAAIGPVGSARVPYRDDVGMRMEVDAAGDGAAAGGGPASPWGGERCRHPDPP